MSLLSITPLGSSLTFVFAEFLCLVLCDVPSAVNGFSKVKSFLWWHVQQLVHLMAVMRFTLNLNLP